MMDEVAKENPIVIGTAKLKEAFQAGYTIGRVDGAQHGISPAGDAPDRATRAKEWFWIKWGVRV